MIKLWEGIQELVNDVGVEEKILIKLSTLSTGVYFTNIFWAAFSYESRMSSFYVLELRFNFPKRNENDAKGAHKMLVKLTTELKRLEEQIANIKVWCHSRFPVNRVVIEILINLAVISTYFLMTTKLMLIITRSLGYT